MIQILLLLLLGALLCWAVFRVVSRFRRGGGCCPEHEAVQRRVKVRDKNRKHYPYAVSLSVGGMTCENCARRVENALNGLEGVWARVDIGTHRAEVLSKTKPEEARLVQAVSDAGYVVLEYEEKHD